MAKFKKVASLLEKKRKISREIENLQNDCKMVIGIPNDEELNNYLK